MNKFKGKTVLITGGVRRLGFEMAKAFAAEGANVVCHYFQSLSVLEEKMHELKKHGVKVWSIQSDLREKSEAESLFSKVLALAGKVDIVVHNASVYRKDQLRSADVDQMQESMFVHAWAPLLISRAFEKSAKPGSCILTILDGSLQRYQSQFFSYQMGKTALHMLTKMMAIEFSPKVRVNGLALGPFLPDEYHDLGKITEALPIPRVGSVQELISSLFHLVENEYITGEVLHVDGGVHIKHGQL